MRKKRKQCAPQSSVGRAAERESDQPDMLAHATLPSSCRWGGLFIEQAHAELK